MSSVNQILPHKNVGGGGMSENISLETNEGKPRMERIRVPVFFIAFVGTCRTFLRPKAKWVSTCVVFSF